MPHNGVVHTIKQDVTKFPILQLRSSFNTNGKLHEMNLIATYYQTNRRLRQSLYQ